MTSEATTRARSTGDRIEETLIATLLGAMTIVTFANVVARFLDHNILWALETTVFLFAWLVLIGASYAVKHNFHIGIDIVVNLLPAGARRAVTLFAVACCVLFSVLLLKGSWDYWWPFASTRTFYEVNDIPMPGFLQFLGELMNEGERYEKMPRFIPYVVLPLSTLLLTIRFAQVGLRVWRGEQALLIESHEVEEIYEDRTELDASVGSLIGAPPEGSSAPPPGASSGTPAGTDETSGPSGRGPGAR